MAVLVATVLAAGQLPGSLAVFTDASTAGANFHAGTWGAVTYYLHNSPSGQNTDAQRDLPMNGTEPATANLFAYSTPTCYTGLGRMLYTHGGLSATCSSQNWLSPQLLSAHTVDSSATFTAWYRLDSGANKLVEVDVQINDVLGSARTQVALLQNVQWQAAAGGAWGAHTITITLPRHTFDIGHRIEIVVTGGPGSHGNDNPVIAYDTTTYRASLTLL